MTSVGVAYFLINLIIAANFKCLIRCYNSMERERKGFIMKVGQTGDGVLLVYEKTDRRDNIMAQKETLSGVLALSQPIRIKISMDLMMDIMTHQLLLCFCREAALKNTAIQWVDYPESFDDMTYILDTREALGMHQHLGK
jgi:hypothetical protein